jgi:cob(I)alamin adenosyltransferase
MTRIYTRGGDKGETGLRGGHRVPKSDPRIVATGDIDELNACLGVARAELGGPLEPLREILERIQHELFILGSELATTMEPGQAPPAHRIGQDHIQRLESDIDHFYEPFKDLNTFVLPGGGRVGACLHLARTVARRAERSISQLTERHQVRKEIQSYVNRLSDTLFALALAANHLEGMAEIHPDYTR